MTSDMQNSQSVELPQVIGRTSAGDSTSGSGSFKASQPQDAKSAKSSKASCLKCMRKTSYLSAKSTIVIFLLVAMGTAFLGWKAIEDVPTRRNYLLSSVFAVGLGTVALEDILHIDKSSVMLICAGIMWTILAVSDHPEDSAKGMERLDKQLEDGVEEVGKLLLFLLPAMGLCESIDHFNGFAVVAHAVQRAMAGKKARLMPIICILTFLLCTLIDSMSAMLVALKTLRRLEPSDHTWRQQCGALAVLGANACVWSPIGEVTTAMLWIGGKITPQKIAAWLILPSLVSLVVPLLSFWAFALRQRDSRSNHSKSRSPTVMQPDPEAGRFSKVTKEETADDIGEGKDEAVDQDDVQFLHNSGDDFSQQLSWSHVKVFLLGIFCIVTVPVLKMHTDLPPYFGMLFALGLMWFFTDMLGIRAEHDSSGVIAALHKVDIAGLLFFAGVLQSVSALNSAGVLRSFARWLKRAFGDSPLNLSIMLGLSSSLVDNVPLVEAAIDMFDDVAVDAPLWQLVALAAGTGGSLLSTGGIAGVTFMGIEGISFMWYFRNVSPWALIGFFAGVLAYQAQWLMFG